VQPKLEFNKRNKQSKSFCDTKNKQKKKAH